MAVGMKLSELNSLIEEINEKLDCIAPIPLREGPHHRIQKSDLREMQQAILSVCADAEFESLDPVPLRVKKSQYDEIRAALTECSCCCEGGDFYETDEVVGGGSVVPVDDEYELVAGDALASALATGDAFFLPQQEPGGPTVNSFAIAPPANSAFHAWTVHVEIYKATTDEWIGASLDGVYSCGEVSSLPPEDAYVPIKVVAFGGLEETYPVWRIRLTTFGSLDECGDCTENPREPCED